MTGAARTLAVARAVVVACAVGAAPGCGAVDQRTIAPIPDPIVIGTFEDLTTQPPDARFRHWERTIYNTDLGDLSFGVVQPGYQSDACLQLQWQLTDPPDGMSNYPGGLIRVQALGSIDLSQRSTLSFAYRYQHEQTDPSCQAFEEVTVNFQCSELNAGVGVTLLAPSQEWTPVSLSFDQLGAPPFQTQGVALADCLRAFDELQFLTGTQLLDGGCSSGTLSIDDVVVR